MGDVISLRPSAVNTKIQHMLSALILIYFNLNNNKYFPEISNLQLILKCITNCYTTNLYVTTSYEVVNPVYFIHAYMSTS